MTDVFTDCQRTLPALLLRQADRYADRTCLVTEVGTFTFSEMPSLAARYGALLEDNGVRRGDRVVVVSENRLEMLALFLGCAWSGAIFVPVNTASKGRQLEHVIGNAEPTILALENVLRGQLETLEHVPPSLQRLWIIDEDTRHQERWREIPVTRMPVPTRAASLLPPDPADTLAVLYTSGTTGPSKGVECPQAQFTYWGEVVGGFLSVTSADTLYTCLPLFHTNALNGFVQALVHGARFVLGPRFSASRFWERLADAEATVTYLLGAMVSILVAREESPLDRKHTVTRALAPATPAELWDTVRHRFGIQIIEGHGMTETNGVIGPRDGEQRPGYMGRTMEGFHARIVGEAGEDVPPGTVGELLVSSDDPLAFASRYWRDEEATRAAWVNGWFHTGDRVLADTDGYYRFLDRAKDVIRRRGENISAWEVEQVLILHPSVAAAAAIGVPSPLGEDDVMACVVVQDGFQLDPADLITFCHTRLAYFAVPRYIEILDELPMTENGKAKKYALRERGVGPTTWDRERAGLILPR
ncbi:MAG: AMP-binding protein [Gaiella sp.]|nr:AMP-binding protein [Gaiella sp.]